MAEQLYWDDIKVDEELTPLAKIATTQMLVRWAGVSGDFNPIHYDKDYAQNRGLPGVIVHGQLLGSFLGQLMTDWIGERGVLRKLSCSYKGMNYPGEAVTCKGKVTKKYVQDGQHYVECNLWAENSKEEKTASGMAIVMLPWRADYNK